MPPDPAPAPETAAARLDTPSTARVVAVNLLVWGVICTLGAAGTYRDELRLGHPVDFPRTWGAWLNMHVPLFGLSVVLARVLPRLGERLSGMRAIGRLYVVLALVFFPLHMAYICVPGWLARGAGQGLVGYVLQRDNFTWFLEFAWFSGTYAVVMAVHAWRLGRQRTAELQDSRNANLRLQLALEQQRLHAMRQQLEPHFIFNALNSISALVRADEKSIALEGIESLSALFRYALRARARDAVDIGEEVAFCRDYLDLQRLRYGDRLQVAIEGLSPDVAQVECPPLLLQPLLENALRHDLDRHDGTTRLALRFRLAGDRLHVQVWNSLGDRGDPHPGLGLGLVHARERLALRYGPRASLALRESTASFEVLVELPAGSPE